MAGAEPQWRAFDRGLHLAGAAADDARAAATNDNERSAPADDSQSAYEPSGTSGCPTNHGW
ncbi:hypothetical protein GCM10023084_63090 [Streptomyces lacrimifluminis]|uniref:Uncharacterized protein n=1 Tax=Streptomyces lacrimifluminis TaxID=1500077 RepID=A0A917NZ49_9ACTN|nr:hypothetical protein GCM10012282_44140 [Streptomyces lacrimifluminis]